MNSTRNVTTNGANLFFIIGLLVVAGVLCSGCGLKFDPGSGGPTDTNAPSETPNPDQVVTVQFRNLSPDEAVDVEFFLSDQPLDVVPDDLFQETLRVRTGIGVAGTGIIEPLNDDTVQFACGPNLALGTTGGLFLDNESGAQRGVGAQRWAQDEALGLCGSTIVFEFVSNGNGFDTIVRLGN